MNLKKILALLLALVMVFALCACGGGENKPAEDGSKDNSGTDNSGKDDSGNTNQGGSDELYELPITVWCPNEAKELTEKQIEDFNKNNTYGIHVTAQVDALSEADAATQMLNDVNTGADMYFFAQDQFARLVKGNALSALPDQQAGIVAAENIGGVVAAGKTGDKQYAYPLTNDNGYFMYYDKSVIPEEDVDSLEALIADCEAASKYFAFEVKGNAWYAASFFFGAGCHSEWLTDDDGTFISIDDDFNSDAGLAAVKGMQKLVQSKAFVSSSKAEEFSNGAAIVVSGNWDFVNAQNNLGDNLGVTDLPSFEADGVEYHLGSFSGCKLLGVKPQSDGDRAAAIHILAEYLTSEAAQTERFEALAWGPANTNAAAAAASPALSALSLQNQYATPQGNINGDWWSIAGSIADEVIEAKSDADLKAALQNYDDKISAVFVKIEQQANAPAEDVWGVVGSMTGWGEQDDYPMSEGGGVFVSDPIELHAGDELKCRLNASWDTNYGADGKDGANVVVEADGLYIVVLDLAAETVFLQPSDGTVAEAWGVVGSMTGWGEEPDFAMTLAEDGTYVSEPLELAAGTELKCRLDSSWDMNYGADGQDGANVVVEADGTYIVVLDLEAGTVTLQAS